VTAFRDNYEIDDLLLLLGIVSASFILWPFQVFGQLAQFESSDVVEIPIEVGESPGDIAVNPSTNTVYVAEPSSNTLSIIDGKTNEVLPIKIPGDGYPEGITVNPSTNTIYVADPASDAVYVVDGKTNKVLPTKIPVVELSEEIAVNPNTNTIYVGNTNETDTVSVIDGKTNKVLPTKIPVVDSYDEIVVNPSTNTIYVANTEDVMANETDTVSVIDGKTNQVLTNIFVDSTGGIAVNPNTGKVYLTCGGGYRICVMDSKNNNLTIATSKIEGSDIALNPNTNTIYVLDTFSNTISVLDGKTNEKVSSDIEVGERPRDIAVNPNTNTIYVAYPNSNRVSVIDENDLKHISNINKQTKIGIKVGRGPDDMAINPTTELLYVVNRFSNTVSVIDATTDLLKSNIEVGESPNEIAVNPNTNKIYVSNAVLFGENESKDTVSVIDGKTNKVSTNISVNEPGYIAVDTYTDLVYVAGFDTVSVIDGKTNKVSTNISVDSPGGIAVDSFPGLDKRGIVYVANSHYEHGTVSAIDGDAPDKVLTNITVGEYPNTIAVNPITNLVYVANLGSDSVSVIDPFINNNFSNKDSERDMGSVVANIPVGDEPEDIDINPNTNTIYVSNAQSDTVSVIDGKTNKVSTNIPVENPRGIAVNPNTNTVYVTHRDSNIVSVIDGNINAVVVGATFKLTPPESGQIICNKKEEIPTNTYVRIKLGSICNADANTGFVFNSWIEEMGSNSTKTITKSTSHGFSLFSNPNDDNYTSFEVSSFGNFVANFREAPSPVPEGIWIALFSILIGTFMPSIIRWINGWKQRRRFYKYKEELPSKYENKSNYKNREAIDDEITELYAKGKINETQQKMLKDKIAEHYDERSDIG